MSSSISEPLSLEPRPRIVTVIPELDGLLRVHDPTMTGDHTVDEDSSTSKISSKSDEFGTITYMRGIETLGTPWEQIVLIYQGDLGQTVMLNYRATPASFVFRFGDGIPIAYTKEPLTHEFDSGETRVKVSKVENGSYEIKLWQDIKQPTEKR